MRPFSAVLFRLVASRGRLFHKPTMHNDLTALVIHRVKNIAGYPESSAEILLRPTLLENLDLYGDGDVRAMEVRGWSFVPTAGSLLFVVAASVVVANDGFSPVVNVRRRATAPPDPTRHHSCPGSVKGATFKRDWPSQALP